MYSQDIHSLFEHNEGRSHIKKVFVNGDWKHKGFIQEAWMQTKD